jgi:hypothetical protein
MSGEGRFTQAASITTKTTITTKTVTKKAITG